MNIDRLRAPALVAWQLTRACDLACLHCCTDSGPGKALPGELSRGEALRLAVEIARSGVPKVLLCGGEPTGVPHFFEVARILGDAGVWIKVETNGQRLGPREATRLASHPVFSVQVSLDAETPATYARQRPGGSLRAAQAACRAVVAAGLPLEAAFAPTRINLHEAEAVVDRAAALGAFRFNSGFLMRLGTAARLWERLRPSRKEHARFLRLLRRKERELRGRMEVCYRPWSLTRELEGRRSQPPATLLVLPDGRVKAAAALPFICSDLKRRSLSEAWDDYRAAWRSAAVARAVEELSRHPDLASRADAWVELDAEQMAVRSGAT